MPIGSFTEAWPHRGTSISACGWARATQPGPSRREAQRRAAASTSRTPRGIAVVSRQRRRVRPHGVRHRRGSGPRRQCRHDRRPHRGIHRSIPGIDHRESRPLGRPRPPLGAGCRGHRGPHRLRAQHRRHSGRRRCDHRGGRRRPSRQAGRPRADRPACPSVDRSGDEHELLSRRRSDERRIAAAADPRASLLQSGIGDEAGRGRARAERRVRRRPGDRVGALARKDASAERRHPRIHRQSPADPVPERRRPSS